MAGGRRHPPTPPHKACSSPCTGQGSATGVEEPLLNPPTLWCDPGWPPVLGGISDKELEKQQRCSNTSGKHAPPPRAFISPSVKEGSGRQDCSGRTGGGNPCSADAAVIKHPKHWVGICPQGVPGLCLKLCVGLTGWQGIWSWWGSRACPSCHQHLPQCGDGWSWHLKGPPGKQKGESVPWRPLCIQRAVLDFEEGGLVSLSHESLPLKI